MSARLDCVLFDLDGTLADTAPDLAAPIQQMQRARGLPVTPFEDLRPFASAGARGLVGKGFGVAKEDPAFPALRDEFLTLYEAQICVHTRLFPGIEACLAQLEAEGLRWGIVSNKIERYVRLLAHALGLEARASCLVGGDSTPTPKPHPAPLLLGASLSGASAQACIYVGDDHRDVVAGRSAGMRTVAAAYGYNGAEDPANAWGADYLVQHAAELEPLLRALRR